MNLFLSLFLLIVIAALWYFYEAFTKRGAVPMDRAVREFTTWLSLVGIALAEYGIELLRWLGDYWQLFNAEFGALMAQPELASFVKVLSFIFLAAKLKAQAMPKPKLPTVEDARGAQG